MPEQELSSTDLGSETAPVQRTALKKVVKKREGASAPQSTAAPQQQPPKQPGGYKYDHVDRHVPDYVREITKHNIWYYRDRMNVPRGPCPLPVLRECWVQGIVDENTLVWGHGLADWLPIRNVRTLVAQIRTLEVQAATWVKRTFALRPALNNIRKQRAEQRNFKSSQVDDMF